MGRAPGSRQKPGWGRQKLCFTADQRPQPHAQHQGPSALAALPTPLMVLVSVPQSQQLLVLMGTAPSYPALYTPPLGESSRSSSIRSTRYTAPMHLAQPCPANDPMPGMHPPQCGGVLPGCPGERAARREMNPQPRKWPWRRAWTEPGPSSDGLGRAVHPEAGESFLLHEPEPQ